MYPGMQVKLYLLSSVFIQLLWLFHSGQDPPKFSVVPGGEYRQEAGRELVIPCEAEGDPFPNITWRKVRHTTHTFSVEEVFINQRCIFVFYVTFSVFHREILFFFSALYLLWELRF